MQNKTIYVCAPYYGLKENYKDAVRYGQAVVSKGHNPIIPYTMLHGVVDQRISVGQNCMKDAITRLLKICDEVWVYGNRITDEMSDEIYEAQELGLPVRYVREERTVNNRAEEISCIVKCYERAFGRVNRIMVEDALEYLNEGMTVELIVEVIKISARKNANWPYARAILERCRANKIYSLTEFNQVQSKKEKKTEGAAYDIQMFEQMLNRAEN